MINRKFLFQVAAFLLTAGAALVALQQTDRFPTYDLVLKIIGAVTICGGLVCVAFALATSASPALENIIFHIRGKVSYITEQAALGDLDTLFGHYERIFGIDLIPKDEFTRWMVKNPGICHKVLHVKSHDGQSKTRIAGFFDFEPLTSYAHKRLLKGVIEGWGLSHKDILSQKTTNAPKCYYIGSVGTTTKSQKDRAATLFSAIEHLRRINLSRPITLLTNPLTPDGLRLCQGFEFRPVNEDKPRGVWVLELPTAAQIPRYERKLLKAIVGHA
jgi:hypothetical protein